MISVIIPVYNGEKYLDECLSSIPGARCDIIVVNDGSTDNSKQIAAKYTNKIINLEHAGPVYARNAGISASKNEYIMFLDADDILTENAVNIMTEQINDSDIIIGLRQDFVSPDCHNIHAEIKKSCHGVISGCALIKRKTFDKIGLFDTDLMCGDGYEWLIRANKAGAKIQKINDVLCLRRIHKTNMGLTIKDQEYKDYCKIIKKHFVKK